MLPKKLQEIRQRNKTQTDTEKVIIGWHELFMTEYGWICIEEFKKLPIPTFLGILDSLHERKKQEKKEYEKNKGRR